MTCAEAYKEHIMYTFNGLGEVVIAVQLSMHGGNRADNGEDEYPLNTSHFL